MSIVIFSFSVKLEGNFIGEATVSDKQIGRYVIQKELGRGGMATVYLAVDPHFQRQVAIKMLPEQFSRDASFRARFEQEARTIARLEHPAIVPVYDFGQEKGQLFLVMRYMPGGSLLERVTQEPMPLFAAAKVVRRIASALDDVHRRSIIHRDLKPDNILFDLRDNAYLSDFGIVKLAQSALTFNDQTFMGTPAYMSPEQARGTIEIDSRSDVYSLGVILFEMLTGQLPFQADTPVGMALMHVADPIPQIRQVKADLPPNTQVIIDRALAKARVDRYATAGELSNDLVALVRATPGAVPKTSPAAPTPRSQPPPPPHQATPREGVQKPRPQPPQAPAPPPREPSAPRPPRRSTPIEKVSVSQPRHGKPLDVRPQEEKPDQKQPAAISSLWLWVLMVVMVLGIGLLWWNLAATKPLPEAATPVTGAAASIAVATSTSTVAPTATVVVVVVGVETAVSTATLRPTTPPTATEPPTATTTPTPTATARATNTRAATATAAPFVVEVIFASVNIRVGPGTVYGDVGFLSEGDRVTAIAQTEDGSWYNVRLENGRLAWIAANVVRHINNTTNPDDIPIALTIPPAPTSTPTPVPPTSAPDSPPPTSSSGGGSSGGGGNPTSTPEPPKPVVTATPVPP